MGKRVSRQTKDELREKIEKMEQVGALSRNQARILRALLNDDNDQEQETATGKNHPLLLPVKVSAKRLHCSERTILRMLDDGTLSRVYLRPGNAKSLRIPAAEVEALAAGEVQNV